jgi:Divergent InlB B-repeat domain
MGHMRFGVLNFSRLAMVVCLAGTSLLWAQDEQHTVVVKAAKHAIAPPLSQIQPILPQSSSLAEDDDANRLSLRVPHGASLGKDSVLQADTAVVSNLSGLAVNSGVNILGLGTGFTGYSLQAVVPDTNGAAGATQFVQFVNESFAVFNKSNGSLAYGPAGGNTLWQALGAPCSTTTNLDEVVVYDKLANRWVMMMPVFASPDYLCFAVSTTSDATNGSWNLYAFPVPGNKMPDYPKLAVWGDGYYISYNQGSNLVFVGASVCALNRAAMLAGNAATMQCFRSTPTTYGVLLPADLDGTTAPPTGSPEYFVNFDGNDQSLDLWQFHVNWTTPANSTFTGPTNIPVAAFTESCGETIVELNYTTGACVPQAGTTQGLDSYGDRLMFRLGYRNFGSYASLVANHTVTTGTNGNQTGIRWYELQNSGSGFKLHQQGTYAPDSSYRWMGSIAMDKVGDIALGYSVSSSTTSPSIRYTGRLITDPLGQMDGEVDVLSQAGITSGSQTNTFHWGDYSSMAIDPTDDCTFWYTTEYQSKTGNDRWSTRIASFSFPSCTQSGQLTVNETGQGTVTSTDGAINCTNGSGTCSAYYPTGSAVTLNASPASGWNFSGWSGACSGSGSCNLTMNSSLSTTATFTTATQTWTLNVNEVGQGTVTSSDGAINCTNGSGTCSATYTAGSSVTLNAAAAADWRLVGWSGVCTSNPCTLVMEGNASPTATFATSWSIVHMASNFGNPLTSLTIPSTGSGNLIAVAIAFNGTTSVSSVSDNAGNTYLSAGARATRGAYATEIWYAVNSKSGATAVTPRFVGSPTHVEITEWEVNNVATSAPDAKGVASGTITLNNTPGPAVTTTQAGDFVISVMLAGSANLTAMTTGNEFTDDFKTNGNGWAHITSNDAAAGTHQASWFTANPVGIYCASTVAFLP